MVRFGSPALFAQVREFFEASNYTETEVCRRFGIPSLEKYEIELDRQQIEAWDDHASGLLTRLFTEGSYVPLPVAQRFWNDDEIQALADLGLIETDPTGEQLAATVSLYPTQRLLIASDRWNLPDRGAFKPAADVVYPAIVSNAQRFLRLMPRTACEGVLDLCSGTGVAALAAAKSFAKHAWAFDIAERSTLFGEFNRQLNGVENATMATGDLYAPAKEQTFDRVVAHPPYVPVLRPKWIYHDGGEDGEQIVRRCIAELPGHLAPGGLFYLLAMLSDRNGETVEQRVRKWLGESSSEFDLLMCPLNSLDVEDFAVRASLAGENPVRDLQAFKKLLRTLGVTQMLYTAVLLQRRAESRETFTIRRQATAATKIDDMLAVLGFETAIRRSGGLDTLLGSRIAVNREAELSVGHTFGDEGWQVSEYLLRVRTPFSMDARTDPWAPFLLGIANGSTTVAGYLDILKEQAAVPPDVPPQEFARAVAALVSGGFLVTEDRFA